MSKEAQIVREIIEEGRPKKKAFELPKEDSLELFRLSRDVNRAVAEGRLSFEKACQGFQALLAAATPEVPLKKVAPKPEKKEEPPDVMGIVAARMKEEEKPLPDVIPPGVDTSAFTRPPPPPRASHWLKPTDGGASPKRSAPKKQTATAAEPKRFGLGPTFKERPKLGDQQLSSRTSVWVMTPSDRATLRQIFGDKLVVHSDLGVIAERHGGSSAMAFSGNIEFPSRKGTPESVIASMESHHYKPASSYKGLLLLQKALEAGLVESGDQFALVLEEFEIDGREHIALVTIKGDSFHVDPISIEDFAREEKHCLAVRTK